MFKINTIWRFWWVWLLQMLQKIYNEAQANPNIPNADRAFVLVNDSKVTSMFLDSFVKQGRNVDIHTVAMTDDEAEHSKRLDELFPKFNEGEDLVLQLYEKQISEVTIQC